MSQRLVVNFIKCDAHGICAELFPEWIRLDDWGYPIVEPGPVPPALLAHATRSCRMPGSRALALEDRAMRRSASLHEQLMSVPLFAAMSEPELSRVSSLAVRTARPRVPG